MKRILLALLVFGATNLAFAQNYDSDGGDPVIKEALDAEEIKYDLSVKGNYKVVMKLESGRTQLVVVNSRLYDYRGIEIREIWSTVKKMKNSKEFSREELFNLLSDNSTNKIGSWQIDDIEGTSVLNFSMRIPANISPEDLRSYIELMADMADKMEEKTTGTKDEF